jgi:hypothetical protein
VDIYYTTNNSNRKKRGKVFQNIKIIPNFSPHNGMLAFGAATEEVAESLMLT